jgi:hypothetical protein
MATWNECLLEIACQKYLPASGPGLGSWSAGIPQSRIEACWSYLWTYTEKRQPIAKVAGQSSGLEYHIQSLLCFASTGPARAMREPYAIVDVLR